MADQLPPHHRGEKFVQALFDRIARRYDLLNRVISFHLDTRWREKAVRAAIRTSDRLILDVGTGTGDLALTAAPTANKPGGTIIGLDLSLQMLRRAREKSRRRSAHATRFVLGSALAVPFKDERFDVVMTAFALRNIPDLPLFFRQANRALRAGGRLVTLDMFPPPDSIFARLYALYFYRLVPWIGAGIARERGAYQYLSDSVRTFATPEAIAELIRSAGFRSVAVQKFFCGAVCLHTAEKPEPLQPPG
ncbi:MAG: ubiquinone/menaquinone biosynthesis methyltransferase [Deltaproteobacteria bacterium]|nr:ubiquinone/menaquinone biosynthesis methyltransferase [Deltaproteobacteria bacterium]